MGTIKVLLAYAISYICLVPTSDPGMMSLVNTNYSTSRPCKYQKIPNHRHHSLSLLPRLCSRSRDSFLARRQRRPQTLHLHLPCYNLTWQHPHVHIRPLNAWLLTLERKSTSLHAHRPSSLGIRSRRHRRRDPPCTKYSSELSSDGARGRALAQEFQMNIFGLLIAYGISLGVTRALKESQWAWRIPIMVMQLYPILLVSFISRLPESPRYFMSKEQKYEAQKALEEMWSKKDAKSKLNGLQEAQDNESDAK
jgi:hypothetical protein